MPQAVGAVVGAVGFFFASIGVPVAVAAALSTAFVYAAGAYLLNRAIQALAPKLPRQRGTSWTANYSGTTEARRIIYGEVRIGGMQTIPPFTSGTDNQDLHMVLSLAGHECEDIGDVFLDDLTVADASIGSVTGTDADGLVSSGRVADKCWIRRYLGTSTQTVDYILSQAFPTAFTSDFRGRGIAYMALRMRISEAAFPSGVPGVTALVKGKKVYDPRTSTTVWSVNPALHTRDWLVNEVGFEEDQIDDDLVEAAANICDQTVDVPGGTQARYTNNILLLADEPWEDGLKLLVDSMRGRAIYRDGVWRIYAGTWDVPEVDLDQSAWVSPITVQASAPRDERWNEVQVFYVDSERQYTRQPAFPRTEAAWVTADGERIPLALELPGVNNDYTAQRHGEFALRASRNQIKVSGRLKPQYVSLTPQQTITLSDTEFGWSFKTFRVVSMDITATLEVDVVLVEEGEPTWTDLEEAEYDAPGTGTPPDPGGGPGGPFVVDPFIRDGYAWWLVTRKDDTLSSTNFYPMSGSVTFLPTGENPRDGLFRITRVDTHQQTVTTSVSNIFRIYAVRSPAYRMVGGAQVSVVVRWRRTGSLGHITLTSSAVQLHQIPFMIARWHAWSGDLGMSSYMYPFNVDVNIPKVIDDANPEGYVSGYPGFNGVTLQNVLDAASGTWNTTKFSRYFAPGDWLNWGPYHTIGLFISHTQLSSGSIIDIGGIDAYEESGAQTFMALADVNTKTYAGQAGKAVVVNNSETGLIFGTAAGGGGGGPMTLFSVQSNLFSMVGSDTSNSPAYTDIQFNVQTVGQYVIDGMFEFQCNSGGTTLRWQTDATSGAIDGFIRTLVSRGGLPSSPELATAGGFNNNVPMTLASRRTTFLTHYAHLGGRIMIFTPSLMRLAIFNTVSWGAGGNNGNLNRSSWARLTYMSPPGTYTA